MMLTRITLVAALVAMAGCSASAPRTSGPVETVYVKENPVPGTVTRPWVEPMYDQVKVPGQIDPAGNYYRLPHQTIVEIRTDRVQEVQYGDEKR